MLGGYRSALVEPGPEPAPVPAPAPAPEPPGRRHPRTAWTVLLPVVAAAGLGFGLGLAPVPVAVGLVAAVVLLGLFLHLGWAAMLVVVSALFEDYLARVDSGITKGLAVVLVVSWIVRLCQGRARASRRNPVITAAVGFAAALALATAVHNNGQGGLDVVLRYAGFLAVLFVLADSMRDVLDPRWIARGYVAACAAASVCGLVSYGLGEDRRVGGPIADPNDLAFFLLPAIALGPAVRGTGRRRWLWDVATVVVAVAIAGTLSRGALVGLAGMGVLALAAGMVRLRTAVGLLAALGASVLVVSLVAPTMVSVSLQQKSYVADQNVTERLDLWKAATRMTLDHPLVGMGPGAFAEDHRDFTTTLPDDVNHPLDVAHDTWLELSSELGLVGLAAFVALLGVAFAQAWRAWRRRGDPLGAAVCASLVGTALAATFVTEQYYLPFWLLAALGAGVATHEEPT